MSRPLDIVLGIDLGTTFSAMAYVNSYGKPEIIPNADGHATTPSVIHFYDEDGVIVGEEAVKMVVMEPENIVRFIKRSMGEQDYNLEFYGRSYTPQEMSALILRKLKEDAEELLGDEIFDAVITVPAYFNSAQRGATAEAGAVAGLNVLSIINEPTAAAIAYGLDRLGEDRTLLVFDLGGGTFDVTVMQIEGRSLMTIASDGNAELGGKDWDDRLVNYVAEAFADQFEDDPRDEPSPFQELYERCLAAKISLSSKDKAIVPVNFKGNRTVVPITREHFELITEDLVQQCVETSELVLEKAGMTWSDIDDMLLVGGATRMPMIRTAMEQHAGQPPITDVNPDECVALGAALAGVFRHRPEHPAMDARPATSQSQVSERPKPVKKPMQPPRRPVSAAAIGLADGGSSAIQLGVDVGRDKPSYEEPVQPEPGSTPMTPVYALPGDVEIRDATTHPLGIVVLDRKRQERVVELIPEGTPLPHEFHGRFAYAYENMRAVRVEVTEGHGSYRDEITVIGKVELTGLPPRPKGTPIDVIYRYDVDQILAVQVVDVETGQSRQVSIKFSGGLDGMELDAARSRNMQMRVD
ncbi:MAG: molecular chaperone DnaK (HSP70) [Kiritimatiellia bacterium]|jgi:molecular chaperone DnaK (HSP70)